MTYSDREPRDALPWYEIAPGTTFGSIITNCVEAPNRSMEHEGVSWTDKIIDIPGIRTGTHISVGQHNGVTVEVDIYQPDNPFTPPRITCDMNGEGGKLTVIHNDVADEGGQKEYFAVEESLLLDERVTQLFRQYFIRQN